MKKKVIYLVLLFLILVYSYSNDKSYSKDEIPSYSGNDYVVLNNNIPYFSKEDKEKSSFEEYYDLDYLGRATGAFSNISAEIMPNKERESISSIKPTGFKTVKYDSIDGKYLYNRCHLIGYQLTGENANIKNLITCTRHMNTVSMLPFENEIAFYIKKTNNHVLYRVTPVYTKDNLVADGVIMEAYSIEDNGEGVMFNVFVYNIQDGIEINYKNGDSKEK